MVGVIHHLRPLAVPSGIGLADTSMGQEDAMAFSFEAAEKLRQVEELAREIVACTLLTCRQAWALRDSPPADGLERYVSLLSEVVPPVDQDRPLGPDIAAVVDLLSSGAVQ
jgi:histidine ammonia-lyase